VSRHAVVIALPHEELVPVSAELRQAGFEVLAVSNADELESILSTRRNIALAILDGEVDFDQSLEYYALLHDSGRSIPALMVVSARAMDRLTANVTKTSINDEYFTRPYSAESIRWRVEAMCIRSQTVDDGSGAILQSAGIDFGDWSRRATVVAVFNPKGGVGKTTIATNLAATLQVRKNQRVLLIDGDTVTGHVTTSLGLEQVRTMADAWRDEADGGEVATLMDVATAHPSGIRVVDLTDDPLHMEDLDPERVTQAINLSRRAFDYIVIDLHPSYGSLNQAIFMEADQILVPVTPDVPALRAALQLRDVATEMGIQDRIKMVVNRANSGVSVADMERTVGSPALGQIRSGGLLFVRAANEGRTVIERFPKDQISDDFDALADSVMGPHAVPSVAPAPVRGLFGRVKEPIRV
jgi:pilus assembly protein CpaE